MAGPPTPGPMDAEEWVRAREILHRALELAPELRSAYLDEACGLEAGLRAEVESLIAASAGSAFIDRPAMASSATATIEPAWPPLLNVGQTIAQYQVIEKIGEGGMGEVYLARDQRLDRFAALKVLGPLRAGEHEKRRFIREAQAASALNHPNIVTIYEFSAGNGLDFMAMEYVKGSTLKKLLEERRLPLKTLLQYARQVAAGVARAHAAGIAHRDLKPGNIMITEDGAVKVLDFGIAKKLPAADSDADATMTQGLTEPGTIVGTPAYMSPEQAKGEPADWRSDIFSFGVITYEIVCGRRPFKGVNSQATLYQIVHNDPPPVSEVNPAVAPDLARLIEKCLKKVPTARPRSMADVAAALADLVEPDRRVPVVHRRAVMAGVLGATALASVLLVGRWPVSAPVPQPMILTYSLEAQKMQQGGAIGEPYVASASDTFEGGWKFRVRVQSPQSGFLYLVNRGPYHAGATNVWILYPLKSSAASIPANQEVTTGWYVFDQNAGTESLWIVWSEQPVKVIEEFLRTASSGRVESQGNASAIERFLSGLKPGRRTAERNGANRIELAGDGRILGEQLELKHR